ncbi:uncharacterized protein LOC109541129 [Dendroctonus ponderosae]|uniref:MD-2-related lipid-recognition domain-containing protein n=1 Tax=Dendroctonus ponderosae TaxID=77166 RepID=A0AAR5PWP8_DENPD|nr:uncharacterized protein LOC109541129 [Dendroctonus ponderosae]KAH1023393.1 hypothetical protein HUJ04_012602 [Dendroctonus ponderosae]KAH1029827.1 hypothetical protein HUJ05_002987 [Dendroctonus ponderosae]
MYVNTIANCKDFENSPLNWSQITFDRDPITKDFSFNIELTVHKEVSKKFGIEFNIWKCENEGSLDSCEYFLKEQKNFKICSYLLDKNQFWSVFTKAFVPPLVCPIKTGVYKAMKIPFQSSYIRFLPIQQPVIRGRLIGWDDTVKISCVDIEIVFSTEKRG